MPAAFHRFFSLELVPELSSLETHVAWPCSPEALICFKASTGLMPVTFAGSLAGPTMTKKLYAMILRFTPYPLTKKLVSCVGSCTIIMSASPLWAVCMAMPVPWERKLRVIQGYFAWKAVCTASKNPVS